MERFPHAVITEQPGFQSISYGLTAGMQHVKCYLILYKTYTNLGFPHGIELMTSFPFLKGTGKTHRHVKINAHTIQETWFNDLLFHAFARLID